MVLQQPWHPQAGFLPLPDSVSQVAVMAQRMKVLVKVTLVKAMLIQVCNQNILALDATEIWLLCVCLSSCILQLGGSCACTGL